MVKFDSLHLQAKLCKEHGIAHIVNNAYGVQSAALCQLITAACRKGRVDAIVQSTDKNFMVCVTAAHVKACAGTIPPRVGRAAHVTIGVSGGRCL